MNNIIIGLKGERRVGKSEIANHLVEKHGFVRVHPFDGGKVASRAYFMHLGADEETAFRMTDGDLKDVSHDIFPVITNPDHVVPGKFELGDHYAARFFMEKFGKCMGVDMGPDFTIGKELQLHLSVNPGAQKRLIVESIVYEADHLHEVGGHIVDIVRDDPDVDRPIGMETDQFGKTFAGDYTFKNTGNDLAAMLESFDEFLGENFDLRDPEPEMAM